MKNRPLHIAFALAIGACFGVCHSANAQFTVDLTDDASTLASTILGTGVTIVGTPTLSTQPGQSGTFTNFDSGSYTQTNGTMGQFNIASGILLTTGIASGAEGNYIGGSSSDMAGSENAYLSAISGTSTFDANVLTIQFASAAPTLQLNFLYASAEYPGSVGSGFGNDPIAILLNGVNLALVPGTSTPVSVEGVNADANSNFFTQYSNPGTPFNYGGITTILTASGSVSTTEMNTIQFAIADAGDGSVDSALFISGGSVSIVVPESGSLLMFLTGAGVSCGLIAYRRKRVAPQA